MLGLLWALVEMPFWRLARSCVSPQKRSKYGRDGDWAGTGSAVPTGLRILGTYGPQLPSDNPVCDYSTCLRVLMVTHNTDPRE